MKITFWKIVALDCIVMGAFGIILELRPIKAIILLCAIKVIAYQVVKFMEKDK